MTDIILEEGDENEPEIEFIEENLTYAELITAAFYTLDALSSQDEKLLSKGMETKIKQARNKAIDILLFCIDKLHEQI